MNYVITNVVTFLQYSTNYHKKFINDILLMPLIAVHLTRTIKNSQKVYFMTVNQRVTGSSPVWGARGIRVSGFKN